MTNSHPSTPHPAPTTAEPGEPGCAGGLTVLDPPGLLGPADAPEHRAVVCDPAPPHLS